jgi:hypothetical protein
LNLRTYAGTGARLLGALRDPRIEPLFLKIEWGCLFFLPLLPDRILLVRSTYDGLPSFYNRSWSVHAGLKLPAVFAVFGWRTFGLYLSGVLEGAAALVSFFGVLLGALWLAQIAGSWFE